MDAAWLASTAETLGFDLVGVAPVGPSPDYARFQAWLARGDHGEMAYLARRAAERADPRLAYPPARSILLVAASYFTPPPPAVLRRDPSRGQIAAYAWGQDYHDVLRGRLYDLDAALRTATGRSTRGRVCVDAGPLLERSWAQAAGLGFIGKNTCLIAPGLGSWLFLAALLVDDDLPAMPPAHAAAARTCGCGACTRCLDICPTAALTSPHHLDARRCISYLTIELRGAIPHDLRPLMGNWIFGCDLCQDVCPYNRRLARLGRIPALALPAPDADQTAPRLLELLALDEAGFRRRFRGTPVLRAKRRGLLRNVCVALGNWADPAAIPGLTAALGDPEPLVRSHAAWALGRIAAPPALAALHSARIHEHDPAVLDEIDRALSPRLS